MSAHCTGPCCPGWWAGGLAPSYIRLSASSDVAPYGGRASWAQRGLVGGEPGGSRLSPPSTGARAGLLGCHPHFGLVSGWTLSLFQEGYEEGDG